MTKVKIANTTIPYAMPVCLVGVTVKGKPTFTAVAWFSKVTSQPPMFMVSLAKPRYSAEGIKENGIFSINFPGSSLVDRTDFCGMFSGRNTDKSEVFKVEYGEHKAPMIEECPVCYELKLVQTVDLADHYLFIGEVVAAYADGEFLTDRKLDVAKTDQFQFIESPAAWYHKQGGQFEKGYSVGKKLTK